MAAMDDTVYAFNTCVTHNTIIFIKIVTTQVRGKGVAIWYVPKDMEDDCLLESDADILPVTWRVNIGAFDE